MIGVLLALVALLAAALALPASAHAASCPPGTIADHLASADVAFVGRLVSARPVATETGFAQFNYRFRVDRDVKGAVGRRLLTVRAARLIDLSGKPLTSEVAVGVLASSGGGRLVTSSCGLVDAGSLLGAADQPKGGTIKVLIGLAFAALVLAYSVRRLRRRRRELERS